MYKKFASQVGILILINIIIKLIWLFGIERKLQITVGFENYGAYYSLFNLTLILSMITDPGLSNYLVRSLASDKEFRPESLFSLKIFLSFIYILLALGIGLFTGYQSYFFYLLLILAVYQLLWSFLIYLRAYLKGLQFFGAEIFFSVFDKVLLIALFIPLLYTNTSTTTDIYFFAASQVIAVSVSILICILIMRKKGIVLFNLENYKPDFSVLKELLPFALFAFLVLAYNKADVIMLDKLLPEGKKETGIYAAAYRVLDASNMMAILFASLFLPAITKLIKDKRNIVSFVKDSFELLISLSLIISFSCWFYKTEIMMMLYGDKSSSYLAQIFGVLMFSSPLIVLYYVFSTVLTANNNLRILNVISAIGLIVNISLNLYFIPKYGALGASYSTIASLAIIGITYLIYYQIYFKAAFNWISISKIIALIVILSLTGNLFEFTQLNWMLRLILFCFTSLLFTIVFGLISIKKLVLLFKSQEN